MNSRAAVPGSLCGGSYGQDWNDREPQTLSKVKVTRTESLRGRKSSLSSSSLKGLSIRTRRERSEKEENHNYRPSKISLLEEDRKATERILVPRIERDTRAVEDFADIKSGCLHNNLLLSRDSIWKHKPQQRLHPSSNRLITKRKWMHLKAA